MTDEDLDLVETDALIQALKRRHLVAVVAFLRPPKIEDRDTFEHILDWSGGIIQSYGLASYLKDHLAWCMRKHDEEHDVKNNGEVDEDTE